MHPGIFLFSATMLSNANYYYNPFEMSQQQLDSISYSVSTLNAVYSLHNFFEMEAMKTAFISEKENLLYEANEKIYNIFVKMTKNPENLRDISNPSFFEQLFAIYEFPDAIKYIEYPSRLLQKLALSLDIKTIQYIKNMDLNIKLDAIKELVNKGYNLSKWIKKIK